jgi:type III pantothenate kinase
LLLAVDIGNTHIVVGLLDDSCRVRCNWRIAGQNHKTEDEYGLLLQWMLQHAGVAKNELAGGVIASVVPPLTPVFEKAMRVYLGISPLVVGPGTKTGVNIKYENPKEVGPDRIANAVAGYHKYGGPVIVVDFGTATTFDAISQNGDYMGGAIAPGIMTATDALFSKAARLPRIELVRPPQAIGRNTIQSMQSGIVFGFAGQTDALVKRISAELGGSPRVVATGGHAQLVASESETITDVDPTLTLEGLYLIHKMNTRA